MNIAPEKLKEIDDSLFETAVDYYKKHAPVGEHPQVLIIEYKDAERGPLMVHVGALMANSSGKDLLSALIARAVKDPAVAVTALVSETWFIRRPTTAKSAAEIEGPLDVPSQAADRREGLMVAYNTSDGSALVMHDIIRDANGVRLQRGELRTDIEQHGRFAVGAPS